VYEEQPAFLPNDTVPSDHVPLASLFTFPALEGGKMPTMTPNKKGTAEGFGVTMASPLNHTMNVNATSFFAPITPTKAVQSPSKRLPSTSALVFVPKVVTAPLFVSTVTETTTSYVDAKAKSFQGLEITSPAPSPTDGSSPVLSYPTPTFTDPAPMSLASPSAALTPLPGKREGSSHSQTPGGSTTNIS
jgi:hypothetical protein